MGCNEEILGNAAPPHSIEHGGKRYTVRLIDQATKAAFARTLLAREREAARELKELMTPEEWSAHLSRLNKDYVDGKYGLLSPRGREIIGSDEGPLILGPLLFGCSEDEFLSLLLTHREEVAGLIRLVLYESFPGLEEAVKKAEGADPNSPSPRQTVGA